MKDLSKDTVSIIVGALITARREILKSFDEAGRVGHTGYQATLQHELDVNAAALRELNQEVAPWLEYHPELQNTFARKEINLKKGKA